MKMIATRFLIAIALGCLHGCVLAPVVPMVMSGIGNAASYSISNTAYKTEIYPEKDVLRNSIRALNKMGFVITDAKQTSTDVKQPSPARWEIAAETAERKISVELERITPKTTKITINVMEGSIVKDKATAEAIIVAVEALLKEEEKSARQPKNSFLFVKTKPPGATVRIKNIAPRFQQGIELPPGSYKLEISMDKFETRTMDVRLDSYEERVLEVAMKSNQ